MNDSDWINLLPAGLLILLIFLLVWFFLKTRRDSHKSDNPPQDNDNEPLAQSPIDINQLDAENQPGSNQNSSEWRTDAVIALDEKLHLNWANKTAEAWFGFNLERRFRENLTTIVKIPELTTFLESGEYDKLLDCETSGSKKIPIRIRVIPYHQNQLLLQARDISQIKTLESVRRDFVSNASHELKTPVSVIYGYLEMMKQEDIPGIAEDWKPAIHQMYEQTERIKKIIEDMLLLSRLEETHKIDEHDYIDITPLLNSAFENAKILGTTHNQSINLNIDPGYSLLCNHEEIESLITNLISNAIRYTPDNGSINIHWRIDTGQGILSVIDTGIGIKKEDISRVTERFYRSDPARSRETGGTGLGLAIVNHIINRHDATLVIKSELNQGSEFIVTFPTDRVRKNPDQVNLLLH